MRINNNKDNKEEKEVVVKVLKIKIILHLNKDEEKIQNKFSILLNMYSKEEILINTF